jgi:hypothetical protein
MTELEGKNKEEEVFLDFKAKINEKISSLKIKMASNTCESSSLSEMTKCYQVIYQVKIDSQVISY